MSNAPCKGCTYRHLGCHDNCESYREFVNKNRKEREDERTKRQISGAITGLHLRRIMSVSQKPTASLISHRNKKQW